MYSELQAALARRNSLSEIQPDCASPVFHSPKLDHRQPAANSGSGQATEEVTLASALAMASARLVRPPAPPPQEPLLEQVEAKAIQLEQEINASKASELYPEAGLAQAVTDDSSDPEPEFEDELFLSLAPAATGAPSAPPPPPPKVTSVVAFEPTPSPSKALHGATSGGARGGAVSPSGKRVVRSASMSAAAMEAEALAAVRRQNSLKEAELRSVEQQVAAQRERTAKTQRQSSELEAAFEGRRKSGLGTVRGVATSRDGGLTTGRLAAAAPAPAAPVSPAAEAFNRFLTASEATDIQKAYADVCGALGLGQRTSLAKLSTALAPQLPHRSRQLLAALETRWARPEYEAHRVKRGGGSRSTLGCVVVGAGPVGLRTAIELRLVGGSVEVLEARERFARLQVLHLWDWVECDLVELGIKNIDPSIFAAADVRRCQTSQMQHSLMKVALLLGITIRFGCKVDSLASLNTMLSKRLDVLVDASGARCSLLETLGFTQQVCLRSSKALCIVISLQNFRTPEELELRESTWSSQYYQAEFARLEAQGVALENFVYYRSTGAFSDAPTHYFVMTTTSDALAAFGALHDPRLREGELCGAPNQNVERLEAYARQAVRCFVPELASQPLVPGQLSLFDFSERKQSNRAAAVVPGSSFGSGQSRSMCLVTRVGDALQEPFWPEGLGINRGFLGALDCADLVQKLMPLILTPLGTAPLPESAFAEVVRRREELYGTIKRLSGSNRLKELRPHIDVRTGTYVYTLDPSTRYAGWSAMASSTATGAGVLNSARGSTTLNSARGVGGGPRMAFHTSTVNVSPR